MVASTTSTTVRPNGAADGRVATTIQGDDVPITIGVKEKPGSIGSNWTFPPGRSGPEGFTGRRGEELDTWLAVHGRAAGEQTIELILRGIQDEPVVVTGLRGQVVRASQPDATSSLAWTFGCGGIAPREARVNLEDPALRFTWFEEGSGTLPRAPTLRVDTGDIEVIEVTSSVRSSDVSWRMILSYEFKGRTGEIAIDNGGRPFTVTAPGPTTRAYRVASGLEPSTVMVVRAPENDGRLGTFC